MGYHDRCLDEFPNLKSKDPKHNSKRDKLTENAIKRYAETNPEYQKVLDKYYRPDKKLPKTTTKTTKKTTVKTTNKEVKSTEAPMCPDSRCSSASTSSEKLCPNCKQKFSSSKNKVTISKDAKTSDDSSQLKKAVDDNTPMFPPRYPNECTSLILPAMYTEEEKKYYQSKQPQYPPPEKISAILENNSPIRSKPTGPYNIITGEQLYESI